jgi:hypothetical protein
MLLGITCLGNAAILILPWQSLQQYFKRTFSMTYIIKGIISNWLLRSSHITSNGLPQSLQCLSWSSMS